MSVESSAAPARCPVAFDHDSPEHAEHWQDIYRGLREEHPRPWTERHDGYWVATRHKDLVAIAQKPDDFTCHKDYDPKTGIAKGGNTIPPFPTPRGVPNESEAKEWENVRSFLNPTFSPKAVEQRRARVKQFAAALIDQVIETGEFDIVDDLANPLPALVTMDIFGFPLEEWRPFADGVHRMIYTSKADPDFIETTSWLGPFRRRVDEEIASRRKTPKDDLLGKLANGEMDGKPLSHEMIHDMAFNIVTAGVDTTTALTSNALLHLSRHPDHRRRLIEDPKLLPFAREEFVRFYGPVQSLARNAKHDVVVDGWEFKKGERVLLAFASANRDPDVFENPEEVILDRSPNRHVGFGAGMHRCLGSFLARSMFDAMVTEVLTRMPDYQVVEEKIRHYPNIAVINGWINIPATFTPGPKVGASID
jgi:cytochrome P450